MELTITFRGGRLSGEGRDWVGRFVLSGRYELPNGACRWVKTYIGRHDIHYEGYNEGKGVWGRWKYLPRPDHHGGFHIWPVGMVVSDPSALHAAAEAPNDGDDPLQQERTIEAEPLTVGAGSESSAFDP
jgi:hypothetical protein